MMRYGRTMMDRPKAARFLPHTKSDWIALLGHWRKYADWLEAEREQASQDYADLLKDYRALRTAIKAHNGECDFMCNPEVCGYERYAPRRCSACPKDWKIDIVPRGEMNNG
jgi:hypothetical protein